MRSGEAFLDIVWRQFQRNRAAYWSLWLLGPILLIAIFAPLIASNLPLVFYDGDQTIFPWFWGLMNPAENVDFAFNMALLGFVPWLMLALATSWRCRRRGWSGRQRIGLVAVEYSAIIAGLCLMFAGRPPYGLRPQNPYQDRNFSEIELQSGGEKHGIYPPIPFGPTEIDLDARFERPLFRKPADRWVEANDGFVHLLGTDKTGRDVLVQMLYGTRISMTVGLVAVSIYLAIGVVLGALAGYFGGKIDMLISRVIEVVMLFPTLFLILTLVALIGRSVYIIMVVIGITGWPGIARLVRGEVLKQRAIEYTLAAQALGSSSLRIVFRHILPNALSPVLVAAPFGIASAIITEATLSLLGFGVEPPTPSWGSLLQQGHGNYTYWWLIVIPSAGIFLAVTLLNLVGSGLRDAMDPKLRA
ncbi:MAG TPA: ABC transporter permease [Pirellulales bacterium]|jgi:peptide/nickel transport system permease protein|nr:ABC transporter permease [Pirellulales bacterium]